MKYPLTENVSTWSGSVIHNMAAVVDDKKATELKTLDVTDTESQLVLKDMDVGTEVVAQMKRIGKEDDRVKQLSYVKITQVKCCERSSSESLSHILVKKRKRRQ